jgi:preprotein translocase subunit YajC
MVAGGGDAAGWSIFFLLFVILAMLGCIGFFMIRIARRQREHFDPTLSDDYVAPTSLH